LSGRHRRGHHQHGGGRHRPDHVPARRRRGQIRAGGYEFVEAAKAIGTAAAIQTTAQETALHGTQETRTMGESAINVASGTILAGLIGAGAALRS
jgi:hypothetical protein